MIQSGCVYIFGRDKYFRPTLVLDLENVNNMIVSKPDLVTLENVQNTLVFLWNYIRKVMFLDGHVEQWITIFNFQQLGVAQMPREIILGLTQISMDHFIYIMAKAYYLNMSWGCNLGY